MTTYTIREPLICDYIGQFETDQVLTYEQAIEYAAQLDIDWEPEYDFTDTNRSFSVCTGSEGDQAVLPASTKALLEAGVDHRFVARYITEALGENVLDEVRGILEAGVLTFDEDEDENIRELILDYVRENLVITFTTLA